MSIDAKQEVSILSQIKSLGLNAPTREQIVRLQASMSEMEQATIVTEHYFSSGMYCRKVWRPATCLIVGKVHTKSHLFICAAGEILIGSEFGWHHMKAGDVIECQPGIKRTTLALTDAVGITCHRTDKTDLDDIEKELIEPDETALFDSRNQVKSLTIEGEK